MTTITLTANPTGTPSPNIEVDVTAIDAGVATINVWRTVNGRQMLVRRMVGLSASGGSASQQDFEAPPGYTSSYRVEQLDSSGNLVVYSSSAAVFLAETTQQAAWFHNPLDPTTAVQMIMADGSGKSMIRPVNGTTYQVAGRSAGLSVFGTRGGLSQVILDCYAQTAADADAFDSLFGDYDDDSTVPILCVRAPSTMRLPSPLFAYVASPNQQPLNFNRGGSMTRFSLLGDEVAPPAESIIVPLLTYDDFTAFYASYNAFTAAYPDYTTASKDYTIEGTV